MSFFYSTKLESLYRKQKLAVTTTSWRMDETYIKVKGRDCYLYRSAFHEGEKDFAIIIRVRLKIKLSAL